MPKTTNTASSNAFKIYSHLQKNPSTFDSIHNDLEIPRSTLSEILNQLLKENLIIKIFISNKPHYSIYKTNTIEQIMDIHKKQKLSTSDYTLLALLFSRLSLQKKRYSLASSILNEFLSTEPLASRILARQEKQDIRIVESLMSCDYLQELASEALTGNSKTYKPKSKKSVRKKT